LQSVRALEGKKGNQGGRGVVPFFPLLPLRTKRWFLRTAERTMPAGTGPLRFSSTENFRSRLVLAVLSGNSVVFEDIRRNDVEQGTGMRDYEVSFLRLVDKFTNGTRVKINETGTAVKFIPGVILGGELEHLCPNSRSIGYFIEGILPLAIVAKSDVRLTFRGVTNDAEDLSIDSIQSVTVPLLRRVANVDCKLKLLKRGAPPGGGGEALLTCPTVKSLPAFELVDAGLVKRIRGVAYSTRVAPTYANRLIDVVRGVLNRFTADVYIYTDHHPKRTGGESPGYGVSLVAETTTHCLIAADCSSSLKEKDPEEIGNRAVAQLLEETDYGGCVDTSHQSIALTLMALSDEDVSRIRVGRLSEHTVQLLRDLRSFMGIVFNLTPDRDANSVLISCVGTGFRNTAKRIN